MATAQQFTTEQLCEALKYHFAHDEFRPFQLEAIQATLSGRDSLLILPTGGGKTLTFQLPALAKSNCFTVVVGPLMALAKDQVDSCLDLGIDARVWNSDTSDEARRSIQSDLVSDAPEMRLLYTTPESLRHPTLRGYLKEAHEAGTLLAFAIDEAHCVSEWGHDFRPAYLELASLKQDFPSIPIAAMTASCTPTVEAGIIKLLKLQDPLLIKGGFNRPNIQYQVLYKELIGDNKQDDLVEHLVNFIKQREGQCGIIYARLRATCDWLGSALGSFDLDVGVYHAGKDAARRRKVQQDWCQGGLDIVVATVAFGMGIDRSDVRWVLHWDVPASLEGYYQESGRAGRDGEPSEAVLYVSADDLDTLTKLEKGTRAGSAAAVASFSCQGGCKRKKLVEYFGQKRGPCDASLGDLLCDYCSQPAVTRQLIQQWEAQLQRKAVAHVLREQRQAAGLEGGDADGDNNSSIAPDSTADAGTAAGDGVLQAGMAATSSHVQGSSRPRPGVWAPARTHCSSDISAGTAAGVVQHNAGMSAPSRAPNPGLQLPAAWPQDENAAPLPPPTAAAGAAATAGPHAAASCVAGGVLLPQSDPLGAAEAQPRPPADKPQLKKRRLSGSQQRSWTAFRAPRKQDKTSSSLGDATQDAAAASPSVQQDAAPQQSDAARGQDGQRQQPCVKGSGPPLTAAAGRVGLRKGQGRGSSTSRQAFLPPFKR